MEWWFVECAWLEWYLLTMRYLITRVYVVHTGGGGVFEVMGEVFESVAGEWWWG